MIFFLGDKLLQAPVSLSGVIFDWGVGVEKEREEGEEEAEEEEEQDEEEKGEKSSWCFSSRRFLIHVAGGVFED